MNQIRTTSLRNPSFRHKIHLAMEEAVVKSRLWGGKGQAYIKNRRGRLVMRVDHNRGEPGAFRFWWRDQSDMTPWILELLRNHPGYLDLNLGRNHL